MRSLPSIRCPGCGLAPEIPPAASPSARGGAPPGGGDMIEAFDVVGEAHEGPLQVDFA